MENAGLKAWLLLKKKLPSLFANPIVFFIGPGNNGGDGLVIARQAIIEDHPEVHIVTYKESKTMANKSNLNIIKNFQSHVFSFPLDKNEIIKKIAPSSTIIDGLLGIGLKKKINEPTAKVIHFINQIKNNHKTINIVALDIPSGMGEGAELENIVKADLTVTFGLLKKILLYPYYHPNAGKIYLVNPGFPSFVLNKYQKHVVLRYKNQPLKQELKKSDFKNSRGSVLILGGSKNYLGAPVLAGLASFKTGAGMVSMITRKEDYPIQAKKNNTLIVCPIKDFNYDFSRYDCILIGPGLSKKEDQEIDFFKEKLFSYPYDLPPLVFDADGIYFFKRWHHLMKRRLTPVVLTPHIGEMKILADTRSLSIKQNPYHWGELMSEKFKSFIILKTHLTYIFTPTKKTATLHYPNPSLGVAGSGDILGGIVSSVMSYQVKNKTIKSSDCVFEILKLATSIHSLSGKLANKKLGLFSAEELIGFIPLATKMLILKQ